MDNDLLFTIGGIVIAGAAALIGYKFYNDTNKAQEKLCAKRRELEKSIDECEEMVNEAINNGINEVNYKSLIDLHYASMRVADEAYKLRNDNNIIINKYKDTLMNLKQCRERIYPLMKDKSISSEKKKEYREEFNSHGMLRSEIFKQFEAVKQEYQKFNEKLSTFNAITHKLKNKIRDDCGWKGQEWFERLEARTRARRGISYS